MTNQMNPTCTCMRTHYRDALALLVFAFFTAAASAQSYSINKFAIAGGGSTSTGGLYSVSGTTGQPDASGPLSGGTYTLVGGFWPLPSAVQTPGAPLLSVEQPVGGNVRIFWSLTATNFVLDQTTALVSPPASISWSQVAFPYQTNATQISVTIPAPGGHKIYRLRKP